jgi:hypothetical protein
MHENQEAKVILVTHGQSKKSWPLLITTLESRFLPCITEKLISMAKDGHPYTYNYHFGLFFTEFY